MYGVFVRIAIATLAVGLCAITAPAALADPDTRSETRISPFSGKPVPRYETLRYAAARGRAGPSTDYPVVWRYERKGLPLLIIKETQDWRRVRDPDGDEVWMHARMLEGGETLLVQSETPLRRTASTEGKLVAQLGQGLIVRLLDRKDGWLQVEAQGRRGWASAQAIWGTDRDENSP